MLEVARLMIRGAIERRETRGVHFRNDFPDTITDWRAHIGWQRGRPQPLASPLEAAGASCSGRPLSRQRS
jgi:succinate dehydrogenase/fumarate reductase flavoprotein subunit